MCERLDRELIRALRDPAAAPPRLDDLPPVRLLVRHLRLVRPVACRPQPARPRHFRLDVVHEALFRVEPCDPILPLRDGQRRGVDRRRSPPHGLRQHRVIVEVGRPVLVLWPEPRPPAQQVHNHVRSPDVPVDVFEQSGTAGRERLLVIDLANAQRPQFFGETLAVLAKLARNAGNKHVRHRSLLRCPQDSAFRTSGQRVRPLSGGGRRTQTRYNGQGTSRRRRVSCPACSTNQKNPRKMRPSVPSTRRSGRGRNPTSSACTRSWRRCSRGPGSSTPQLLPGLDPEVAREVQRGMARLEKAKSPDSPVLPQPSAADAAALLDLPRRPRPVHQRLPHPPPARRSDDRPLAPGRAGRDVLRAASGPLRRGPGGVQGGRAAGQEWKQDPQTLAYLTALDAIEVRMADRYLRDEIRTAQPVRPLDADGRRDQHRLPVRPRHGRARRRGRRRRLGPAVGADRAGPGVVLQALLAARAASKGSSGCASSRSFKSRTTRSISESSRRNEQTA